MKLLPLYYRALLGLLLTSALQLTAHAESYTGDFDKDGWTDVISRNETTGKIRINYFTRGFTVRNFVDIGSVDMSYQMIGVGDFNGDGSPDILWRRKYDGMTGMWMMRGSTVDHWETLFNVGDNIWTAVAINDCNADGKADIVFQQSNGQFVIAYMNGSKIVSTYINNQMTAGELNNWTIVGSGYFPDNGLNRITLIIRNKADKGFLAGLHDVSGGGNYVRSSEMWIFREWEKFIGTGNAGEKYYRSIFKVDEVYDVLGACQFEVSGWMKLYHLTSLQGSWKGCLP